MTVYDYLKKDKESIPRWLLEIKEGDPFPYQDFFASRIVYYPGSYTDGHAVKVFGSTHSAHSFIYVDYWLLKIPNPGALIFNLNPKVIVEACTIPIDFYTKVRNQNHFIHQVK
jgi:hypothetical protein